MSKHNNSLITRRVTASKLEHHHMIRIWHKHGDMTND